MRSQLGLKKEQEELEENQTTHLEHLKMKGQLSTTQLESTYEI